MRAFERFTNQRGFFRHPGELLAMLTRSSSSATVVLMALIIAYMMSFIVLINWGRNEPAQAELGRGTLESVVNVESMKFHTEYLTCTRKRSAPTFTDTAGRSALKKSGIKDGMILVSAMHITAGVYVMTTKAA